FRTIRRIDQNGPYRIRSIIDPYHIVTHFLFLFCPCSATIFNCTTYSYWRARASFRLPSIIPISPNFWTEAFGPFKGSHFLQVSALQNSDASLCAKIAHFRGQYVWSQLSFYLMAVFHFTHGIAYSDFRTTTEKGGSSTFATPPLTLMYP